MNICRFFWMKEISNCEMKCSESLCMDLGVVL